ncbi:MAG TPA: hypothetical protein VF571_15365 [Pyrinomonadaceae bacterium]
MAQLSKKVEMFISISILVLSVFVSELLIHKYIFSSSNPPEPIKTTNKQITLSDINWSEQSKTLIVALDINCRFCNESAPFYKHLIETLKGKNVKLIAVLPSDIQESRTHLNKLGLVDIEVKQAALDDLQVNGTPTLLLVNDKGEVTNYWVGKLPLNKQAEVINKITS